MVANFKRVNISLPSSVLAGSTQSISRGDPDDTRTPFHGLAALCMHPFWPCMRALHYVSVKPLSLVQPSSVEKRLDQFESFIVREDEARERPGYKFSAGFDDNVKPADVEIVKEMQS